MSGSPAAERAELQPDSPLWGEHRSRYHYAASRAAGKRVLDIACGTGFGAPILRAAGAQAVIGFDLSWDALRFCEGGAGELFCRADGAHLPIPDGTVDIVTSFETIEHIRDHQAFVRELHRVLKPGGTLVISTPNALHTKPVDGVPRNPFHVKEFTPGELQNVLSTHFRTVSIYGQRPSESHRPCPYWEGDIPQPNLRMSLVAVSWKAAARLPRAARERLWRMFRGVSFHPGEHDFSFGIDGLENAHALVGICER